MLASVQIIDYGESIPYWYKTSWNELRNKDKETLAFVENLGREFVDITNEISKTIHICNNYKMKWFADVVNVLDEEILTNAQDGVFYRLKDNENNYFIWCKVNNDKMESYFTEMKEIIKFQRYFYI